MTLSTVPVVGTWLDGTGQPEQSGSVILTPFQEYTGGGYIIVADPKTVALVNGTLSSTTIADASLIPPLQLAVTERIGSSSAVSYVVQPTPGQTLDLSAAARGTSPTVVALYVLASQVGAAGGVAPLDATKRVPAVNTALVPQSQTLTYASTITTDVSTSSVFRVTLTGNLTLANPVNALDNQRALWQFTQDATGGRTLTLGSAFDVGQLTVTLSTAAGKVDYMLAVYRAAASKWDVLAFGSGY